MSYVVLEEWVDFLEKRGFARVYKNLTNTLEYIKQFRRILPDPVFTLERDESSFFGQYYTLKIKMGGKNFNIENKLTLEGDLKEVPPNILDRIFTPSCLLKRTSAEIDRVEKAHPTVGRKYSNLKQKILRNSSKKVFHLAILVLLRLYYRPGAKGFFEATNY